jgi:hypothetical protein
LIKLILKFTKPQASMLGAFWFLNWKIIEFVKNCGGRGDYTRIFIAGTRRCAQFSLGAENLIHRAVAASDFF